MTSSSEKQKRYDRQLRLWGEHGQACMEECTVCLINGTGCGAEALKNLVLPGMRQTTGHRTALRAAESTLTL
jgi:amyloid beta precursor protein binding protein 1